VAYDADARQNLRYLPFLRRGDKGNYDSMQVNNLTNCRACALQATRAFWRVYAAMHMTRVVLSSYSLQPYHPRRRQKLESGSKQAKCA